MTLCRIPLHRVLSVFMVLMVSFPGGAGAEPQRVALVVGNANYLHAARLANPVNDAHDMADMLRGLGYDVIDRLDAPLRDMEDAVRAFGGKLQPGSIGLFYYAGHGLQVNGVNYLVPVDATISKESDVKYAAMDVGRVMDAMRDAGNDLNVIILDACRDNPFATGSRSAASQGLARMDAPTGTFIAYATAPGSVAADGDGRNGVFTQYLLRYIKASNLEVEKVMKKVRVSVMRATGKLQVPWQSSSLTGEFMFKPGPMVKSDIHDALDREWEEIEAQRKELARLKAELARTGEQKAQKSGADRLGKAEIEALLRETSVSMQIQESCPDCGVGDTGMAQTVLAARLAEQGLQVVSPEPSEARQREALVLSLLKGDARAARELGLAAKADYVVAGRAVIKNAGEVMEGTGLNSVHANVQLTLVNAATGRIVGAAVKSAVAAHVSPLTGGSLALDTALSQAVAETIRPRLAQDLENTRTLGAPLTVFALGVDALKTYRGVMAFLKGVSGASAVKSERWDKENGLLVVSLRFAGQGEDLAMELDERTGPFGSISLTDVGPATLDLRVH
ncbi:MAG: caspase family protein [Desulfovibrionaceae bacterium]